MYNDEWLFLAQFHIVDPLATEHAFIFFLFFFLLEICSKNIELENGFLSETHYIYSLNKTTQYRCKPGYVTSTGKMSGSITCLQNGWSPQPSCISEYFVVLLPLYW